tara:strand:+ start:211 stop:543 length:333 start_codon:yes stop_codon:yes gene_type:complete
MVNLQTLKTSKDFQAAKNGKFFRSDSFLLQALKVNNENIIKVGYTVTKQNGNAVNRNRIKRRLRQVVANVIHKYGKNNWNYVLIGKKKVIRADFEELNKEFISALKKIHE